jgi:hypothetical protein
MQNASAHRRVIEVIEPNRFRMLLVRMRGRTNGVLVIEAIRRDSCENPAC